MQLKTLYKMHEAANRGLWKLEGNEWIVKSNPLSFLGCNFLLYVPEWTQRNPESHNCVSHMERESSKKSSLFMEKESSKNNSLSIPKNGRGNSLLISLFGPALRQVQVPKLQSGDRGNLREGNPLWLEKLWYKECMEGLIIVLSLYGFLPLVLRGRSSVRKGILEWKH